MRLRALPLVLACCVSLSGCYELIEPVLDKGDYAPLSGAYNCSEELGGKKRALTFSQESTGWFFRDYRYKSSDGTRMTLQKLDGKFYLVETLARDGALGASFAEFISDDRVALFTANILGKADEIQALANKHKLNASYGQSGNMRLVGEKANVLSFLRAHDRALISLAMTCARVKE